MLGLLKPVTMNDKRTAMANQPDINKYISIFQVPLEIMAILKRKAAERKMSVNQFINFIFREYLDFEPLTDDDFRWIKRKVEENEKKRNG